MLWQQLINRQRSRSLRNERRRPSCRSKVVWWHVVDHNRWLLALGEHGEHQSLPQLSFTWPSIWSQLSCEKDQITFGNLSVTGSIKFLPSGRTLWVTGCGNLLKSQGVNIDFFFLLDIAEQSLWRLDEKKNIGGHWCHLAFIHRHIFHWFVLNSRDNGIHGKTRWRSFIQLIQPHSQKRGVKNKRSDNSRLSQTYQREA